MVQIEVNGILYMVMNGTDFGGAKQFIVQQTKFGPIFVEIGALLVKKSLNG